MFPPGPYTTVKHSTSSNPPTREDLIEYFSFYNTYQLGEIKRLYVTWVECKGATSEEAVQLSNLFSSCVDGERVSIPENLLEPPSSSGSPKSFIVNNLMECTIEYARKLVDQLTKGPSFGETQFPGELLKAVVNDQSLLPQTISQFELFCVIDHALKYQVISAEDGNELFLNIDYSLFSQEEKQDAFKWRPELKEIVQNALTQSNILKSTKYFTHRNWKRFFSSSILGPPFSIRLFDCMFRFTRKLILLRPTESEVFGVVLQQELFPGINPLTTGTYAFATDNGFYNSLIFLPPNTLEIDVDASQNRLQIYRSANKGATFLWMRCYEENQSSRIGENCRVSIDLTRLDRTGYKLAERINKKQVIDAELFVLTSANFVEIFYYHSGHYGPIEKEFS